MGYQTYYRFSVSGPPELMEEFEKDADKEFGEYELPLSVWIDDDADSMKWYDYQTDTEAVSKEYPGLLFHLEGEGEEAGDLWKLWARNGKSVRVKPEIVYRVVDLDAELPSPDMEKQIEAVKQARRDKIQKEIDRLKEMKADI